jgi:predicted DCC family thiol-disulfide oxidoreductase YuxK
MPAGKDLTVLSGWCGMKPIERLWIVYDAACGLCTGVKDWIGRQESFVPIEFVASGSAKARKRFPQLPPGELAVVGDTGEVWLGNNAWIICLWALRDYRGWSVRLSSPFLRTMAREAFAVLSSHRGGLSRIMGLRGDIELEQELRKLNVPKCAQ